MWSYVRTHVPAEDGSLGDDAFDAVSGGLVVPSYGRPNVACMTYACRPTLNEGEMKIVDGNGENHNGELKF